MGDRDYGFVNTFPRKTEYHSLWADAEVIAELIDLAKEVRENAVIDLMVKENVRLKLRVMVKRILRKYGYPPDKQEKATRTVLEQAEVIARDWAE